nr:phosphoribosylanthranilate isomerase [Pseudoalteromonas caenipelagi]
MGFVADDNIIGNEALDGHVLPSLSQVKHLFTLIPNHICKVALVFRNSFDDIASVLEYLQPDVVHIACKKPIPLAELSKLRSTFSHVKIMLAIAINKPNAITVALGYQHLCDYFLLDSEGSDEEHPYGVGATGATHDWNTSAELVNRVAIPVVLAGGLSVNNVNQAINIVKPWAVDSFTHTNLAPNRLSRKDPKKVSAFINLVKGD